MSYFFVLFLRLVAYFEGGLKMGLFALTFVIIASSSATNFFLKRKIIGYGGFWSLFAFSVILLVMLQTSVLSTLNIRDTAVLFSYLIWFVYAVSRFYNRSLNNCLKFLLYSFLIYNIINLVFYHAYYAHISKGVNTILGIFGIMADRVYFPLASGSNINTAQIGICTLIAAYLLRESNRLTKTIFFFGIYVLHIYLLIVSDSRLILTISVFLSILIFLSFYRTINLLKRYWLALSFAIIGFLYIFYDTDIFDFLKRPGEHESDYVGRIEVWKMANRIIFDGFHMITGRGLNGLEDNLPAYELRRFEGSHLQTSHNLFLQTWVDFGVIGLGLLLLGIQKLISKALQVKGRILVILLVAVFIFGTTESIPTFYSFEATLLFLGIVAIILTRVYDERTIS